MAESETTKPQFTSSTKLSAEADSFVPGCLSSIVGSSEQTPSGRLSPGQKSMTPQQLSQLPRYMTSCYPFVQGDPGPGPRSSGTPAGTSTFQGPGRPPAPHYTGQRMPAPQSGGYNFPGTRPPGPQNFAAGRGPRHQGILPRPGFPGSHQGANQALLGVSPFPAGSGQLPMPAAGQGYQYYPYGSHMPPAPGWSPPNGAFPPDYGAQFALGYPREGMEWTGTEWVRTSGDKERKSKKKKEKSNMVSVGVQNESTGLSGPLPKQKKQKTRTIILMDAAIQTDFSEEIANLTLAQKANSLYKTRRWPEEYDPDNSCTTTDSEEVDSDSGYSSPLHRRNQMSNGTHPVGGTYPTITTSEGQGLLPKPGINPHIQNCHPHSHSHTQAYPFMSNPAVVLPFSYSAVAAGSTSIGYNSRYMQSFSHHMPTSFSKEDSHSAGLNSTRGLSSHGSVTHLTSSAHPLTTSNKTEPEEEEATSSVKKKRRRNRRRRKKTASGEDMGALSDEPVELRRAHSSSNVSRTSMEPPLLDVADTSGLRFEDEEEFPNLLTATANLETKSSSQPVMSYSDILKSPALPLSQDHTDNQFQLPCSKADYDVVSNDAGPSKESKNARKRRKRREMANKAAEEELAEITLEQQVLRELSAKHHQPSQTNGTSTTAPSNGGATTSSAPPTPASKRETFQAPPPKAQPAGKKSKQPICLNIADMIDALEKQQEQQKAKERQAAALGLVGVRKHPDKNVTVVNLLDASAPSKRGKEREVPKAKKPSPLKKVILKEREEKKRMRLLDEPPMSPESEEAASQILAVPGMPLDGDLSQDDSKTSSVDTGMLTPMSAEMSPISQNSPISMSPLSPGGSPLSSGINSPVASNSLLGERKPQVVMKIHSRRFREYCTQILDKDIDNCCTGLLQDLVRFQDRLYHKDPTKVRSNAKSKRRIVLGLREVTKHLRLKKIKVVIISPNLERIQSKGGLDEALNNIIQMCTDQEVPFVFALGRRALGRACAKLVPVSVVGIFSYEGSEENYHNLMDLTEVARKAYTEMVSVLEKEQQENPSRQAGTFPPYYAHMGHSRTPSACSAISFTSSILSEPISENYPQSEPETDSRGYEIIREALIRDSAQDGHGQVLSASLKAEEPSSDTDDSERSGKVTIVESLDEIDEGHEADTEDIPEHSWPKKSSKREQVEDDGDDEEEDQKDEEEDEEEEDGYDNDESDDNDSHDDEEDGTEYDRDTVRELPHIDSIHSSVIDLSTEILSQHSSKTLDLNTEVLSTHSSKTPGESNPLLGTSPIAGEHSTSLEKTGIISGENSADPGLGRTAAGTAHKLRTPDKERIESWVAEAQQQMERLSVQVGADEIASTRDTDLNVAILDVTDGPTTAYKEDCLNDNHTQKPGCCSVCDAQQAS